MQVNDQLQTDIHWMRHAIQMAHFAQAVGEVPVGAVVVRDEQVLGEGWNRPIQNHDPSAHAEVIAMRAAGESLGNYRIPGATLYVTLEPCVMCAGAIMHARFSRVVFGACDPKAGAAGSVLNIFENEYLNHHVVEVVGGVLQSECGELLSRFFKQKRCR